MRGRQQSFIFGCALVIGLLVALYGGIIQQSIYEFAHHQITLKDTSPGNYINRDNIVARIGIGFIGFVFAQLILTIIHGITTWMVGRWDRMAIADKVNLFLGSFIGIIAALPFLVILQEVNKNGKQGMTAVVTLFVIIGVAALAVYALNSMEEVLPWSQMRGKPRQTGFKILDTNVIIDGRIYDVARTGFLEGKLYVPRFVLEELQHIADSADPLRRQRGRRGLDVLTLMQSEFEMEVGTYDRHASDDREEVDARLVRLAGALGAELVTNDVNLNRVAALQNIKVLNLNDLAMAVKPNVLPRETLLLLIAREGNQSGQGIGYLEDGTMVVVENGRNHIGETARVVVTQVIQTERGKMIFADLPDNSVPEPDADSQNRNRRRRDV